MIGQCMHSVEQTFGSMKKMDRGRHPVHEVWHEKFQDPPSWMWSQKSLQDRLTKGICTETYEWNWPLLKVWPTPAPWSYTWQHTRDDHWASPFFLSPSRWRTLKGRDSLEACGIVLHFTQNPFATSSVWSSTPMVVAMEQTPTYRHLYMWWLESLTIRMNGPLM